MNPFDTVLRFSASSCVSVSFILRRRIQLSVRVPPRFAQSCCRWHRADSTPFRVWISVCPFQLAPGVQRARAAAGRDRVVDPRAATAGRSYVEGALHHVFVHTPLDCCSPAVIQRSVLRSSVRYVPTFVLLLSVSHDVALPDASMRNAAVAYLPVCLCGAAEPLRSHLGDRHRLRFAGKPFPPVP